MKMFTWPSVVLTTLIKLMGDLLNSSILCSDQTTVGTSFSGSGTVEQGLEYIKGCAVGLGVNISCNCVSAVDYARSCIKVLQKVLSGCIFNNILRLTKMIKKLLGGGMFRFFAVFFLNC